MTDLEDMVPSSSPKTTTLGDRIRPPTEPSSEITTSSLELTSPRKCPSIRIGSWKTRRPAILTFRLTAMRARSSTQEGRASLEGSAPPAEFRLALDMLGVLLCSPGPELASEIRMLEPFRAPGIHGKQRHDPRGPQSTAAQLVCKYLAHKDIADGSYRPWAD
jgi:hypothetical protein